MVGVLTIFRFFSMPIALQSNDKAHPPGMTAALSPDVQQAALARAKTTAVAASVLFSSILLVFSAPLIAVQNARTHTLVDGVAMNPTMDRERLLKQHGLAEPDAIKFVGQGPATLAPFLTAFLGIAAG